MPGRRYPATKIAPSPEFREIQAFIEHGIQTIAMYLSTDTGQAVSAWVLKVGDAAVTWLERLPRNTRKKRVIKIYGLNERTVLKEIKVDE